MEIIVKVGDKRFPDHPAYNEHWRDGHIIDIREDGHCSQGLQRKHHCVITTQHDFWKLRGTTDWKSTNAKVYDLKKYLYPVNSQDKHPWDTGHIENDSLVKHRRRDHFIDFKYLLNQEWITQKQYDDIYNHDVDPGLIYLDRDFTTYLFQEDTHTRLEIKKNQLISAGVYQIGTGGGADYATIALFEAAIDTPLTGDLTGEHQNEETAIAGVVQFDTDTATHLLKLTAESGAEHNGGAYGNGARINYGTSCDIRFDETNDGDLDDAEISKLALDISGSANYGVQAKDGANAGLFTINRLLVKGDADSVIGINVDNAPVSTLITNNIIYKIGDGAPDSGIRHNLYTAGRTISIYNNTVIGCYDNIVQETDSSNGTINLKNNLCQAGQNQDYRNDGGGWDATAKNVSEDATSPDGAYQSKDVHTNTVFQNYAGNDFRLDSAGDVTNLAILDDGDDLSVTFEDDIEGQTRSTWYIGASEIVAVGGRIMSSLVGPGGLAGMGGIAGQGGGLAG